MKYIGIVTGEIMVGEKILVSARPWLVQSYCFWNWKYYVGFTLRYVSGRYTNVSELNFAGTQNSENYNNY